MTSPKNSGAFTLIGHEARFEALSRAAMQGQIPQTLLISGTPHLGKSTFARCFAQLLLCENPAENGPPLPCGHCRSCHQVAIGSHPDYGVFRPLISASATSSGTAPSELVSSIISVDQARQFAIQAQSSPLVGKRKVLVLEQADRMTAEAQNALLKTFEEPAHGLTIILLCDNANVLLPTVRSRCWEIRLGLVSDGAITSWLQAMDSEINQNALELALRAAGGHPGIAWREWNRSKNGSPNSSRLAQMEQWVDRFSQSLPVAALKLSSEAQKLAMEWWEEDLALGSDDDSRIGSLKGAESKVARSAIALFLDQLMTIYRTRWRDQASSPSAGNWAEGLDQIRKTRHYILRNANTGLALDVLFCRLLNARQVH